MHELAPNRNGKSDLHGIAGLAVATLLLLALGDWPYGYYKFLRIVICAFSVVVIHREWPSAGRGWLLFAGIGAFLFNPILSIRMERGDWEFADLIFAIGYGAYGIKFLTKNVSKIISIIIFILFISMCGLTDYVNQNMPHGPFYATGDIVCENDDRGPCGEEYKEDMRGLDIPKWVKFLRENFDNLFLLLPVASICCISKKEDEEGERDIGFNRNIGKYIHDNGTLDP